MARIVTAILGVVFLASSAGAGDITVKPYGFVLFNSGYNDHIATDIPFRAALTDSGDGNASFLMTARQTRFGIKAETESEGWTLQSRVELDFWGRKGSAASAASTQTAPRLRLAYFSMQKDNITLTFGQDWVKAFAPLNPHSLAHISIVVFSNSGNLWNRLPQIRMDYASALENGGKFMLQLAAVRPIGGDITNNSQLETLGAGEYSAMPFGQARVSYSQGRKFTVGASAHVGQEDWYAARGGEYTDDKTSTWAVAGDLSVNTRSVGFSAEGFMGSNLNTYFSGGSSRDIPAGSPSLRAAGTIEREGIDLMGGWGEIAIKPTGSKVKFHVGAGTEILDEDQTSEMAENAPTYYKNMTAFGNLFYTPVAKVTLALEVGYITTTYKHKADTEIVETDGTNLNINAAFKFDF